MVNAMSTAELPTEQRFVLKTADWKMYREISSALVNRHVRLTYDRGRLEFMTLSFLHENSSNLLGRLIEVLTEELDMPLRSAGSTTLNREDLDKGLEPDQGYYLENEAKVRDKDEIDLTQDPPPDLAVEVDISRSSLNRLGIYAAMGVPEVWRYDGDTLAVYELNENGQYDRVDKSPHFPFLPLAEVVGFLKKSHSMSETQLIRGFRAWVREQQAKGWTA
jgi:Uma2 family endonuclease